MNNLIIQILLCSAWGIILADELKPLVDFETVIINRFYVNRSKGRLNPFEQIAVWFMGAVTCCKCLSYHLFWISYLVIYHSFYGILIGVASYFLTSIYRKLIPK